MRGASKKPSRWMQGLGLLWVGLTVGGAAGMRVLATALGDFRILTLADLGMSFVVSGLFGLGVVFCLAAVRCLKEPE